MKVVSNASPLMNLDAIGEVLILKKLYGQIHIPEAVSAELKANPEKYCNEFDDAVSDWIQIVHVANRPLVESLMIELDKGESEAIALAMELNADLLLIDERRGRKIARHFGIPHIGLLGVLLQAKQEKVIPLVKPILDKLLYEAGFWLSRKLYNHTLQLAGEN